MDAEKKKHFDVGIDEIIKAVGNRVENPAPCMFVSFREDGVHLISAGVTNREIAMFVQIAIENDEGTRQFAIDTVNALNERKESNEDNNQISH